MKIGIVLSNPPGYSETFFTSKIKGLQANGIEVMLFTQSKNKEFDLCQHFQSPKVYKNSFFQIGAMLFQFVKMIPNFKSIKNFVQLERKQRTSFFEIFKKTYLNAHILKQKAAWLHFGFATQAIGSELVAKAIGAKMAVSFRGFDINVYPIKHPNCYQKVWKHVDKVHSISIYLLQKAYLLGLKKNCPFKIITPAVTIDLLTYDLQPTTNKQALKIVTVARLNWIKGIDIAINAMNILKEKGIDFTYEIIGSGTIKEKERYLFQVHQLGLENEIIFHGKLTHSQTINLLNNASIYVQPSYNEGFCNAVLEAQAMGKLCIASDVGGLSENIENLKTGWLVPKYNSQALAEKIIEVVQLPEAEKQKISINAQERVKKQFTIEQQQQKFVDFYR